MNLELYRSFVVNRLHIRVFVTAQEILSAAWQQGGHSAHSFYEFRMTGAGSDSHPLPLALLHWRS